jgi:hypothetical protein
MEKRQISELNQLFHESKQVDKETYAEMRSNILLSAGEHFSKKNPGGMRRGAGDVQESQKLRITKNRIHRNLKIYKNHILSKCPGATVKPQNETNLQDQKAAELNKKVNDYLKADKDIKLRKVLRSAVDDYCRIGEACLKVFWDPTKGKLKGYEGKPEVDESGNELVDEMGQPILVPDQSKPVMTGKLVFERVFGHQIFRDPSAKEMDLSPFIGIEKIESLKVLKRRYASQPDKLKLLEASKEEFVIFDSERMGYGTQKDQVSIREFYFRPCEEYPEGYFYFATEAGVLEEGPLPYGIFPIVWVGFDEHPTKCRATSFIKVARPWQAEINRASSSMALHQVTLGEDKILYQKGTAVSPGAILPGVRGLTYQGQAPTILPGRDGSQYQGYVDRQAVEMDDAILVDRIDQEKAAASDPWLLLFRSMKQQSHFVEYVEKMSEFWCHATFIALDLCRYYMDDEELIEAIGTDEIVNISEFRNSSPLCYKIQTEEHDESIESMLGRQMTVTQVLQYVGSSLTREDIGRIVKNLPFGNWKDDFERLTMKETNVKNDFLSIERGQLPPISEVDDSQFILEEVASRKKKRDFITLNPEVRQLYDQYEKIHEQKLQMEIEAKRALESEMIPTTGPMVACEMYVPQEDPSKTPKRVRIPIDALEWLVKTLDAQGQTLDKMETMNASQLMQIAQSMGAGGQLPMAG